jgi:predicted nucleic acid-binding Zn ribbon protein
MTMIRRRIKRKRKRQMMIIFLLISVDFNLLTKKKINGLLA